MMRNTIERFEKILAEAPAMLLKFTEAEAGAKIRPGKWSKKEIIGHLIDSAANNHQRFVRMQETGIVELQKYAQESWVKIQHYNALPWKELVNLWLTYNRHMLHIIRTVKGSALTHTGYYPGGETFTLRFIMQDYVAHLQHHLKQTGIYDA